MFDLHQKNFYTITLELTKPDGSPGEVEGVPVWEIVPTETSRLDVAPDGMSAEVHWAGVGDGAVLTVTADGDLGAGVFPLVGTETFNMLAPLGATSIGLNVSAETPEV